MNRAFLPFLLLWAACRAPAPDPQALLRQAVEAHGTAACDSLDLSFRFRGRDYRIERKGGQYRYTRSFADSTGELRDLLSNEGFERSLNGQRVDLPDSLARAYAQSVNSVAYFFLLPCPLLDPAAQARYLGETRIRDTAYHQVEIRFAQEGGGQDYQDRFIYWLRKEGGYLDYLAYEYHSEEGGIRFRKAIHPQTVKGFRVQEYINYKADPARTPLEATARAWEAGELKELSRIEQEALR
jgi:hypothetical protein